MGTENDRFSQILKNIEDSLADIRENPASEIGQWRFLAEQAIAGLSLTAEIASE